MTTLLLDLLARTRGIWTVRLFAAGLALALLPLALLVDALEWAVRRVVRARVLGQSATNCPRGHRLELDHVTWSCSVCGLTQTAHAFARCGHCGTVCHAIPCPCGEYAVNPLTPVRR